LKTLLIDIETAPNVCHTWGLWDQNISINQIVNPGYTLCWAAKWLGEDDKEMFFDSVYKSPSNEMCAGIHSLLEEADVVVSYNGIKFDIPTLNKEFLRHGLHPPSPYKQIDLLRTVKRMFRFPSNKLEYVAQSLGLGGKTQHQGHSLWTNCMDGEPKAWALMEEYNCNDVSLLEKVYNKLISWIPNHPNVNLLASEETSACPKCGSHHYQKRGVATTHAGKYQRYQCNSCHSWFRDAVKLIPRTTKQNERFTSIS